MTMNFLRRVIGSRKAASAVEYSLILALIFVAIVGAVQGLANKTITMWSNVASTVNHAG
jgi:pilus assembly protein Flp/PilA